MKVIKLRHFLLLVLNASLRPKISKIPFLKFLPDFKNFRIIGVFGRHPESHDIYHSPTHGVYFINFPRALIPSNPLICFAWEMFAQPAFMKNDFNKFPTLLVAQDKLEHVICSRQLTTFTFGFCSRPFCFCCFGWRE
jgi:hypothetical protein